MANDMSTTGSGLTALEIVDLGGGPRMFVRYLDRGVGMVDLRSITRIVPQEAGCVIVTEAQSGGGFLTSFGMGEHHAIVAHEAHDVINALREWANRGKVR
jgi:hypothetical protein